MGKDKNDAVRDFHFAVLLGKEDLIDMLILLTTAATSRSGSSGGNMGKHAIRW